MSKEIHNLDLQAAFVGRHDEDLLNLLYEADALLTCVDTSMPERIELAEKIQRVVENTIGQSVHWIGMACCEGECDVCNEREGNGAA